MTKEPKLQAAVRIVAEWSDYDQEIKRLQSRVQESTDHTTNKQTTSTAGWCWQVKYNDQNASVSRLLLPLRCAHGAVSDSRQALDSV